MSNKELAIFTIELRAFFLASGTLISIIHHKNCINKNDQYIWWLKCLPMYYAIPAILCESIYQ